VARRRGALPWLNPGILAGAVAPAALILWRARSGELGANPIAEALNQLGLMALVLLIASLACTPLKTTFGWTWPPRARRLLGLLAFAYAALHVSVYAGLDQGLDWRALLADVLKRRFIFVGFAAFVLMIPLAATSTSAAVRRMGYVRWKRLHLLVYPAALCGVIHFIWRVKKDLSEPLVYAAILGVLLLVRVFAGWHHRGAARGSGPLASTAAGPDAQAG
jgi:sulfoxide reductase heme-binding subunit YedZ